MNLGDGKTARFNDFPRKGETGPALLLEWITVQESTAAGLSGVSGAIGCRRSHEESADAEHRPDDESEL